MTSFSDFGLDADILAALEKMGFKEPTPIQQQAIPLIQAGKDIVGLAQTGSGKTAACAIPICNRIDVGQDYVQALIVVPTRELAMQYATETQQIGGRRGIHSLAIYGGADATLQLAKLKHKAHVCIATPGRLIDFIYSRQIDLTQVNTVVLDEADEMLSMGFVEDLQFVFQCLVHDHQTLLFSATMPKEIRSIADHHMKSPQEVKLISKKAAPSKLAHKFAYVAPPARDRELEQLIKELNPRQSIIFVDSRRNCEKLAQALRKSVRGIEFIHGGINQDIRTSITDKFRRGKIQHLIATDVASRGLDFSGVTHVFQWQLPRDVDTYIHRSGRTGRQSREGTCISLVTKRDLGLLKQIGKRISREPEWIGKPPSDSPRSSSDKGKPRKEQGSSERNGEKPRSDRRRRRSPRRAPKKDDS